jgi:hypothetical protein
MENLFETGPDGHDFFSRETCDLFLTGGVTPTIISDLIDASGATVTLELIDQGMREAFLAVCRRIAELERDASK